MSSPNYDYSVGEIVLRKDECFWILPLQDISNTTDTYSPWFSYMGHKWRLLKQRRPNKYIFHLWRKSSCNPSRKKHLIILSFRNSSYDCFICGRRLLEWRTGTGEIFSDCGFEFIIPDPLCHCCRMQLYDIPTDPGLYSENGLVKIYFNILKKESISNTTEAGDEESSNEVEGEDSHESKECSGYENSDDEQSSDEESCSRNNTAKPKGIKKLAENLKQALFDTEFSDIVLKVSDREFNVHKVILAARSCVFESMFKHDLIEKNTNEVVIPDCTTEAFEVFLHYLYCGRISNLSQSNVYDLYYAADKYQVDDLKKLCVKFMTKYLSVETFCNVILLCLRHGESKLRGAATGFFCKNVKKIRKTVQWGKFMIENPTYANELLIKAHDD